MFTPVTSVFAATNPGMRGEEDATEALTAVLYPHWRIRTTELLKAGAKVEAEEEKAQTQEMQTPTPPPTPVSPLRW